MTKVTGSNRVEPHAKSSSFAVQDIKVTHWDRPINLLCQALADHKVVEMGLSQLHSHGLERGCVEFHLCVDLEESSEPEVKAGSS